MAIPKNLNIDQLRSIFNSGQRHGPGFGYDFDFAETARRTKISPKVHELDILLHDDEIQKLKTRRSDLLKMAREIELKLAHQEDLRQAPTGDYTQYKKEIEED